MQGQRIRSRELSDFFKSTTVFKYLNLNLNNGWAWEASFKCPYISIIVQFPFECSIHNWELISWVDKPLWEEVLPMFSLLCCLYTLKSCPHRSWSFTRNLNSWPVTITVLFSMQNFVGKSPRSLSHVCIVKSRIRNLSSSYSFYSVIHKPAWWLYAEPIYL